MTTMITAAAATEIAAAITINDHDDARELLTTLEFPALFLISLDESEVAPVIQAVLNALADRLNATDDFDGDELTEWATEGAAAANSDLAEHGFVITVPTFTCTGETSSEVAEREAAEWAAIRLDDDADYFAARRIY